MTKKNLPPSLQPHSDRTQESSRALLIPEPLNSDEIAALISEMYSIAGSRIGAILVEANNVLTFAGARGQTEFFINNLTQEDIAMIERLAVAVKQKGVSLKAGSVIARAGKPSCLMVNIESLRGYECVSRRTKIPGILPFDSSTDFVGTDQWMRESLANLEVEQRKGNLPFTTVRLSDIPVGIAKGYPDQAVYDATEWSEIHGCQTTVVYSEIEHALKYGGADPNFFFRPDHANDPSILATIKDWSEILGKFYDHSWHQKISRDPEFIAARLAMQNGQV